MKILHLGQMHLPLFSMGVAFWDVLDFNDQFICMIAATSVEAAQIQVDTLNAHINATFNNKEIEES